MSEFKQRRDALLALMDNNSVTILSTNSLQTRSNDTEYPFRPDSDFYYLTGFKEDNATLCLVKKENSVKSYLFLQKKDETLELWTGKRLGVEEAKRCFEYDDIFISDERFEKIAFELENCDKVYCDIFNDNKLFIEIQTYVKKVLHQRTIKRSPREFSDILALTQKMRLIKSNNEITLIKKALDITKEAHHGAMKAMKPKLKEYEVQAMYEYIFKKEGAYSDAYTTIVASGNNANTLHYIENSDFLESGDLVLIDAGCEYEMYASDITRTYPASGKFTEPQKELYTMVLEVQVEVIRAIKPGITKTSLHILSEKLLCEGMVCLGILKGNVETLLEEKKHKKYYPHGIGHWMGIDVHDPCPYYDENGEELLFQEGMVLTIEPGVYLPQDDENVPLKYRGIGIRIEDDILVTKEGFENLSQGIVKSVEAIEEIMSYSSIFER
jgi:Xaa-Pro aminopeptidase